MKLRRLAGDFCVEEINSLCLDSSGPFATYRLEKRHWNTLDALQRVATQWKLPRRNIAHAGLKDRHALTSQTITIRHGPRQSFQEDNFSLEYLGQAPRAVTAADIVGNRFQIVLRSLAAAERQSAERALPDVQRSGIANYFDDQRFGSFLTGCEFIAEAWMRDDYERALWLAFAEHHPDDSSDERTEKKILREHWNNWAECKRQLSRSHRRSIVTFLDDRSGDFKGAWGRVRGELRGLYLSAFQSHLWNQLAREFIQQTCEPLQNVPVTLKPGPVALYQNVSESQTRTLHETSLPLPSARLKSWTGETAEMLKESLSRAGWPLSTIKVKYPRDRFYSRGWRAVAIPVDDLSWEFSVDDLAPGKEMLSLRFSLPRGAYATMLVKRLMAGTHSPTTSSRSGSRNTNTGL